MEEILVSSLNINGTLTQNQQTIADSFNEYFLTTAEKLIGANQIDTNQKGECHYIMYFEIVGIPILILNSGTHHLKR